MEEEHFPLPQSGLKQDFGKLQYGYQSLSFFLFPFSSSSSSFLPSPVTSFRFQLDASITGDDAKSVLHAATESSPVATATTRPWSFPPLSLCLFPCVRLFLRDLYCMRVMFFHMLLKWSFQ